MPKFSCGRRIHEAPGASSGTEGRHMVGRWFGVEEDTSRTQVRGFGVGVVNEPLLPEGSVRGMENQGMVGRLPRPREQLPRRVWRIVRRRLVVVLVGQGVRSASVPLEFSSLE